MVIVSFLFFGTYSAIQTDVAKEEDSIIGKVLDGSGLHSKDVNRLGRFLGTDFHDVMAGNGGANLLNDGFIRKDIVGSGLGSLIFEGYRAEIWGELESKVVKFKQFKPYVHPSKFVSFEAMLGQFAPNYAENLMAFRLAREERELFAGLGKLYVDQTVFPAEMMRRMMLYVEHQYASMAPADPQLKHVDLSLFYAKGVSDWFGAKFLERVAHFVINGAAYATKHGYKVSLEEAKSALIQDAAKHLKELGSGQGTDQVASNEEVLKFYKNQLRALGLEEREALAIYSKVLVLRKMLNEVGNSVFVDSQLYKQFAEFASKGAKVEVYQLPASLKLKGEDAIKKLGVYLSRVSKNGDVSKLTSEFASIDEIKSRSPELVEKRFLVQLASVKKTELAKEIGIRRTWEWELEEGHWGQLRENFSELAKCTDIDSEARFAYMESLDIAVREKIDQFARIKILEEDASLVSEKLAGLTSQKRVISITLGADGEILPGVQDRKALLDLLENGSDKLLSYSQNGEDFYRIEVLDGGSLWEVLTFEEAKQRGILDKIDLKKNVSEDALISYMKKMSQLVKEGDESVVSNSREALSRDSLEPKSPLEKQWALKKDEMRVTRKMAHPLFSEELFSMDAGQWSDIIQAEGGPMFYKVVETFVDTSEVSKKMEEGRALLGKEAKEGVVREILKEMTSGS